MMNTAIQRKDAADDQQLDDDTARRVMGLWQDDDLQWHKPDGALVRILIWHPSTIMDQAWHVVEHFDHVTVEKVHDEYVCDVYVKRADGAVTITVQDTTAPRAICRAALEALDAAAR